VSPARHAGSAAGSGRVALLCAAFREDALGFRYDAGALDAVAAKTTVLGSIAGLAVEAGPLTDSGSARVVAAVADEIFLARAFTGFSWTWQRATDRRLARAIAVRSVGAPLSHAGEAVDPARIAVYGESQAHLRDVAVRVAERAGQRFAAVLTQRRVGLAAVDARVVRTAIVGVAARGSDGALIAEIHWVAGARCDAHRLARVTQEPRRALGAGRIVAGFADARARHAATTQIGISTA